MIYGPEHQQWDSTVLRIGQKVYDVFYRYDETASLNRALDEMARQTKNSFQKHVSEVKQRLAAEPQEARFHIDIKDLLAN